MYGDGETGEGGPFLRETNGVVTTVDVPGAPINDVKGINNRSAVVGNYLDADGVDHAYLMDQEG